LQVNKRLSRKISEAGKNSCGSLSSLYLTDFNLSYSAPFVNKKDDFPIIFSLSDILLLF